MNNIVRKMRQLLDDFRDNDPRFSEKMLKALRYSLFDESISTLFWKYNSKFVTSHYNFTSEAIKDLNHLDGYGFIVPSDWANHCGWILFSKDEDGSDTMICASEDPENPYVVHNFYELWNTVLDYYDLDINVEVERIMDYWEKQIL